MTYRIDTSMNDAPYQGIHIFNDDEHVLTFCEDGTPVHEFNTDQRTRAQIVCFFMNGQVPANPRSVFEAFKYAKFIKPHERIKL